MSPIMTESGDNPAAGSQMILEEHEEVIGHGFDYIRADKVLDYSTA